MLRKLIFNQNIREFSGIYLWRLRGGGFGPECGRKVFHLDDDQKAAPAYSEKMRDLTNNTDTSLETSLQMQQNAFAHSRNKCVQMATFHKLWQ